MGIYLDYNASAPIDPRVLNTMIDVYQNHYGNADSRTHDYGDYAHKIVETARKQVASILGINADEVFFTSGATESNNIAIQGLEQYGQQSGKKHILTTSIEHKAVLESVKKMERKGFNVEFVDPEPDGQVSVDNILTRVQDDTLLVSIMHVNNETGIIQPIERLGNKLTNSGVLFHVDATQSFGKMIDELKDLKYDMLSMSAHKFGGPQGIGALVLRKKHYKLPPVHSIMCGGQQEHNLRPGTIPVALVAGLGKACEIAENEYQHNYEKNMRIKKLILQLLEDSGIPYVINGNQEHCISNTINVCFPGVSSEALMLSSKQYCGISNGSACNSDSYNPSYVLTAMGISEDRIENSIRISWGADLDHNKIKKLFTQLLDIARSLIW